MLDNNHRIINYLRLSVTDRCNLRCIYCMPEKGVQFISHREILSYEEMLRIVRLCVYKGIRKVRVTGGEPLVRKEITNFLEMLCKIEGLEEISLTTNGVLLKRFAADIKNCGISRINVSLDSLKPERFFRITGRDYFERVWEGLEAAEHVEFNPIKINVVAIKGVNDDEILDFANLAVNKPYHIRFIELMPVGGRETWDAARFVSSDEIFRLIQTLGDLKPVKSNPYDGPAKRFKIIGGQGEIGLISALSHHFCEHCNRLRLTPEGHLRGCLFSEQEIDLKTPLRQKKQDDYLLQLIELAIKNKPKEHGIPKCFPRKCVPQMNRIGG
ncbi:MAG: GTP 3',8-cyclase MoaA [Desulfobacterales bacterium]